jgi:cupin 2 domain-containing protein
MRRTVYPWRSVRSHGSPPGGKLSNLKIAAAVSAMKNLFDAMPADCADEVFDPLVDSGQVKIERIVSRGHTSPASGWYDQPANEWVMVVAGAARLGFDDGSTVELRAGDFVNIEAHRRHRVEWTAPDEETVWLAVHYPA